MNIEKEFYEWAATYGDSKKDADRCRYNKSMMLDFALHLNKVKSEKIEEVKNILKFAYFPTKTTNGWIWLCNYKATYSFEMTDHWVNDGTKEDFDFGYEIPNMKKIKKKKWVLIKKEKINYAKREHNKH